MKDQERTGRRPGKCVDVVIVGGGPAGLAVAAELYRNGITDILIIEREKQLGGILRQCIHDGFGLTRFKETLSGPEYASRFIREVEVLGIPCLTDTTVLDITPDKVVYASSSNGYVMIKARAVILAMGCRERTRGAISIPGQRPAGVWTAGVAQAYINLQNRMVGREVVILGSGDIGMIMARRLSLEGAHVQAVFEIQSYASGLPRNIEQCLNDFNIPLYLSHSVIEIKGTGRLEAVVVAEVDEQLSPIPGTEKEYPCDTLILSVGLIPENELSLAAGVLLDEETKGAVVDENFQTGVPGIFAAGNVLHVHDLVDFVSLEGEALAAGVMRYLKQGTLPSGQLEVVSDGNVGQLIPQRISGFNNFTLSMRVKRPMKDCKIQLLQGNKVIKSISCKKALPAEMIQVNVKADLLNESDNLEVKVV